MPKRVQLRRTLGWRKPEGAIVVARPSKWGNPYPVAQTIGELFTRDDAVRLFRDDLLNGEAWFDGHRFSMVEITVDDVAELRGHDLACWCPLDQPCHADVLMEVANG